MWKAGFMSERLEGRGRSVKPVLAFAIILLLLSSRAFGQFSGGKRLVLETTDAQSVTAVLTYGARCDKVTAKEWIFFQPVIPEHPTQFNVTTVMTPKAETVIAEGPIPRPLLQMRHAVETDSALHEFSVEITMHGTLRSRKLVPLMPGRKPPKVDKLSADDRALYLKERGDLNFKDPEFAKWLTKQKLLRRKHESEVDFAQRAFTTIRTGFQYEYADTMDRRCSHVCTTGKSDCGGLSHLFIGVLRENQIPARCLYGRWAMSATPDEKLGGIAYYKIHAKAEFFAEGIGWVPADLAKAILDDKTPAGLQFFGQDSGNFLTFHIEDGFEYDSVLFGKKSTSLMQTPVFWVKGSGKFEDVEYKQSWVVTTVKTNR